MGLANQMNDHGNPAKLYHPIVDEIDQPDALLIRVHIEIYGGGEEDVRISLGYEDATPERDDALFAYALDLLEGQRMTWRRRT